MEALTFTVIIVMLLLVYRSITTLLIMLGMVILSLSAARGVVIPGASPSSDSRRSRRIFLSCWRCGRHRLRDLPDRQISRSARRGRPRIRVLHNVRRHRARGSGFRSHNRGGDVLPELHAPAVLPDVGRPLAIGMFVVVISALTLGPAMIAVASRFGKLLEPKRAMRFDFGGRSVAAIVRWPGPILVGAVALALIGLLTLPGYRTNYKRPRLPPAGHPGQ